MIMLHSTPRPRSPLICVLALILCALVSIGGATQQPDETTNASDDGAWANGLTVLVTGANRGIGLEFARQFSEAGATVIGTARRPDAANDLRDLGVRIEQLDVTDADSVAALAEAIGDDSIDVLINNAGIGRNGPSVESTSIDDVIDVLQVNTVGPMRVTQALLPAMRAGDRKLIVNISSRLGSIEANGNGGFYGYRESKAALNMFTRSLAAELRRDGFTCIAMSPGWVRTDMGGPQATLTPAQSISGMIKVMGTLTVDDSGLFYNYAGNQLDW